MLTITTLLDGDEHVIVHVYMRSDGQELVQEKLVDPATMTPPCDRLSVQEVMYDFAGFDARLEFGSGLVDQTMIWVLPEGSGSGYRNYKPFGGFNDRSGLDGTGELLITTTGFTAADVDQGSLIIKLKKKQKR